MEIKVVVPDFQYRYKIAEKSRKTGNQRWWTVNGQGLYSATLHYRARNKMTKYFHKYLSKHIRKQISEKDISELNNIVFKGSFRKLATSVDIYDIRRGKMPDISNMWLWLKWFDDALQECGVIPDDDPDYVLRSGPTTYHFVDNPKDRKLVFTIKSI